MNKFITKTTVALLTLFLGMLSVQAFSHEDMQAKSKRIKLFIIEPQNDGTVAETFTIKFGLEGFNIAPAGKDVENSGHHHLLIDLETLPDLTKSLPATEQIKHFGGGQTETKLTLSPGIHTLQLLLGDYLHQPHKQPILSKKITIIVE